MAHPSISITDLLQREQFALTVCTAPPMVVLITDRLGQAAIRAPRTPTPRHSITAPTAVDRVLFSSRPAFIPGLFAGPASIFDALYSLLVRFTRIAIMFP
jgi:hypothetical protein